MDLLNKRVLELMEHYGMSKSDFAQSLAISPSIMSHISSGRNKVGVEVLKKIASTYHEVSINYLLTGDGSLLATDSSINKQHIQDEIKLMSRSISSAESELRIVKRQLDQLKESLNS